MMDEAEDGNADASSNYVQLQDHHQHHHHAAVAVTIASTPAASKTSELTLAFEGEVYVFPAVTPEKETPIDSKPSTTNSETFFGKEGAVQCCSNAEDLTSVMPVGIVGSSGNFDEQIKVQFHCSNLSMCRTVELILQALQKQILRILQILISFRFLASVFYDERLPLQKKRTSFN